MTTSLPIETTATEVAFFSSWRSPPRIIKVTRQTASQIIVDGDYRYTRKTGRAVGDGNGRRIENVTPEIIERIAAVALHGDADKIWLKVEHELAAKHSAETEALRKLAHGRQGETVAEVQGAVARLKQYLEDLNGQTSLP